MAESAAQLEAEPHEQSEECTDSRSGYRSKELVGSAGSITIDVPQDQTPAFEPEVVKKGRKGVNAVEQKIIAMYARGMTTRNISDTIMDIYGFEVSEGFISGVTDKLLPKMRKWQSRPPEDIYPASLRHGRQSSSRLPAVRRVRRDAIRYAARDEVGVRRKAAHIVPGISAGGHRDVSGVYTGENESAKQSLPASRLACPALSGAGCLY